jgi:hypothetical protein
MLNHIGRDITLKKNHFLSQYERLGIVVICPIAFSVHQDYGEDEYGFSSRLQYVVNPTIAATTTRAFVNIHWP